MRNAVCGILNRKPLKPPLKELFGPSGRQWLLTQRYTDLERLMLDNDLAHLDALDERMRVVDAKLRELAAHNISAGQRNDRHLRMPAVQRFTARA